MARYQGYNGYAEVGSSAIGERVSFNIELSVAENDGSTQGSAWTSVDAGQKSASGTIEVHFDHDDSGQTALTVGSVVALTLFPTGETTGHTSISGNFLVTSVGTESSAGDNVKRSYSVRNVGTVTIATIATVG